MSSTSNVRCRYFVHGACTRGEQCPFSHDMAAKPDNTCKFYLAGSCHYGDRCRYDHVRPKKKTASQSKSSAAAAKRQRQQPATANSRSQQSRTKQSQQQQQQRSAKATSQATAPPPSSSPSSATTKPTKPKTKGATKTKTKAASKGNAWRPAPAASATTKASQATPATTATTTTTAATATTAPTTAIQPPPAQMLAQMSADAPEFVPSSFMPPPTMNAPTTPTPLLTLTSQAPEFHPTEQQQHQQQQRQHSAVPGVATQQQQQQQQQQQRSGKLGQLPPSVLSPTVPPDKARRINADWRTKELSSTTIRDAQGKVVSVAKPRKHKAAPPHVPVTAVAGQEPGKLFIVVKKKAARKAKAQQQEQEEGDASGSAGDGYEQHDQPSLAWVKAPAGVDYQQHQYMPAYPTQPVNYAHAARAALEGDEALEAAPLCPAGVATGDCLDEECAYLHGIECPVCHLLVLHPYRPEEHDAHVDACARKQEQEKRRRAKVKESKGVECCICLEEVLAKRVPSDRKFGILPNCKHAFCLRCIRKWRQHSEQGTIVRQCPICRERSFFVVPSSFFVTDDAEKAALIEEYRERLSKLDCKHFDFGRGDCPFGDFCFYRHVTREGEAAVSGKPRYITSASGRATRLQKVRLSDFLQFREDMAQQMEEDNDVDVGI
ncbi:hypothetical protein PTSG_10032 [Salpingoeca rosetta]|uniref:RING-type E3 ubiquitin transferase n=1 Tax=Salpingoeca rosetta (strain ATCC 50818 / BSB-021) TaxID=946362 RepID=F2UPB1_SALR5|nr:uncharacterized protein PTSG_10032 [Salpingoeca rosetta]EGD79466.1 hypothetical protein PTSG_10032 [Salpingoeca rosetta]|eukprot:XP_004988947.1 hypothetical protein PTSG_10032 [Salpingoeca rosetta]